MERWLSGRKRQIANLLYGRQLRTEGSNPSLSVFQVLIHRVFSVLTNKTNAKVNISTPKDG